MKTAFLIFWILRKIFSEIDWKFYLAAAGLGALTAIFFEQIAFTFNLWSYGEEMPLLPVLGTGLLPLVQLTVLVPLAIWLTVKLKKNDFYEYSPIAIIDLSVSTSFPPV